MQCNVCWVLQIITAAAMPNLQRFCGCLKPLIEQSMNRASPHLLLSTRSTPRRSLSVSWNSFLALVAARPAPGMCGTCMVHPP